MKLSGIVKCIRPRRSHVEPDKSGYWLVSMTSKANGYACPFIVQCILNSPREVMTSPQKSFSLVWLTANFPFGANHVAPEHEAPESNWHFCLILFTFRFTNHFSPCCLSVEAAVVIYASASLFCAVSVQPFFLGTHLQSDKVFHSGSRSFQLQGMHPVLACAGVCSFFPSLSPMVC